MNHQFQKGTFFMSHFHDFSIFFSKKFFGQKIPLEKLEVVWGVKTHKNHFIRYKVYVESQVGRIRFIFLIFSNFLEHSRKIKKI